MNVVELRNLKKSFENFSLDISSLDIKEGYINGIIGANGAGKTTLMKLILNLLNQDEGIVKIFGEEFSKDKAEIKAQIGYIGHDSYYNIDATLEKIKNIKSKFYKRWDEELFNKYMKDFDININQKYEELSKGQMIKFDLAMILSYHPKLIILDEPTAHLDPIFRGEFLDIIQLQMEMDSSTVIYSTHITSDLDKVGDYFIMMKKGQVVFSEDAENLKDKYVLIKGKNELLDEETRKVFLNIEEYDYGFRGLTNNKKEAMELFGEEVIYEKSNIEDILLYYGRYGNDRDERIIKN